MGKYGKVFNEFQKDTILNWNETLEQHRFPIWYILKIFSKDVRHIGTNMSCTKHPKLEACLLILSFDILQALTICKSHSSTPTLL